MKTCLRHTDGPGQCDFWLPRQEPTLPTPPVATLEYLHRNKLGVDFPKRFRALVRKVEGAGCWLWRGSTLPDGYGVLARGKPFRGQVTTHRAAWILSRGMIPKGLGVLHQCDVPGCCRPDHLFTGSHRANMEDKKLKGRGTGGRKGISHKLGPELIEVQDLAKYRIFSQAEIARQYGISRARVSQVAREAQNK